MLNQVAPPGVVRLLLLAIAISLGAATTKGMDLVELVEKVKGSVVRLDTDRGTGSGVIVDDGGAVLTNFHVVEGASQVSVTLQSGTTMPSRGYLVIDPLHDLALIRTDKFDGPHAIKLASNLPKVGEHVAAFGNPKGFSFTTSEGIVSAIRTGNEIVESIGRAAYSHLGYADDATWIQTTAPISPGNSGGPLVNMSGELVALNTWCHAQGQNLNFAISLPDLQRVLGDNVLRQQTRPFAQMPRTRGRAVPPDPGKPKRPSELRVEFPTGSVFSSAIFDVKESELRKSSAAKDGSQALINYPNGSLYAAASQVDGRLHGVTIGQYESKEPMVFANYLKGQRNGILKTWDASGKPAFYGQYLKGKRHGFNCWHEGGSLRLVVEYAYDELQWIQLVSEGTAVDGFKSRERAEKNEVAKSLLARMDAFEASFKESEIALRKNVSQYDQKQRKALATQLGPQKRRATIQRAAANDARAAEDFRVLERKFFGR